MTNFPLAFTDLAKAKLIEAVKGEPEGTFVRVSVVGGGCAGFERKLDFDTDFDADEDIETTVSVEPSAHSILANEPYSIIDEPKTQCRIVVDNFSALYLKDTTIDFVMENFEEGFKFSGGDVKKSCACGSSVSF